MRNLPRPSTTRDITTRAPRALRALAQAGLALAVACTLGVAQPAHADAAFDRWVENFWPQARSAGRQS